MANSLAEWPQEFCEWVSVELSMGSPCVVQASSPTQGWISINLDCWRDCPGLQTRPSLCHCSVTQSCLILCNPMDCSMSGFLSIISWSLLKLRSIESTMPSNHLIPCCPLLLLPLSSIKVFSSESALHIRWPKYWSFNFSISLSNEYSRSISFRIDWFDLFAVQGTFRSLLHTTVQKHQFFNIQPSLWSSSHIHTWPLEKL